MKRLPWQQFVHGLSGVTSGAFLALVVSEALSLGPPNVGFLTVGALLGIIGALSWGAWFVIPVTAASLGGVLGGATGNWLLVEDARHHRDMREAAVLVMISGALLGAVLGFIVGVSAAERLVRRKAE